MIEIWNLEFKAEFALTSDWTTEDKIRLQEEIVDAIRQHSTCTLIGDSELIVEPRKGEQNVRRS